MLNISLIKAKMRGRSSLVKGPRSRIMWGARIVNMRGYDNCISLGKNCIVRGELLTFAHGGEIKIGDSCYIGEGSRLWSGSSITVGNHVMISHGVSVMDNLTHPLDHNQRRMHYESLSSKGHPDNIDLGDQPIVLHDDVWIGAHAILLRGVKVGARAIIGAGSVVVTDVPSDAIYAGNPAREISSSKSGVTQNKAVENNV